jgi:hypothetical protein
MDFLGLRTLSVIERAKKLIRDTLSRGDDLRRGRRTPRTRGPTPSTSSASVHRPEGLRPLPKGRHAGRVPVRIGRACAACSGHEARPPRGPHRRQRAVPPRADGPHPRLQRRKHGQQEVPKVHPIVDKFTAPTYGVMVYQEQVMQIVHELGGIPLRARRTRSSRRSARRRRRSSTRAPGLHRRGGRQGPAEEEGRGTLRAHPEVRGLRLQQVALNRLRDRRLPDGVPEDLLPRPVHGRRSSASRARPRRSPTGCPTSTTARRPSRSTPRPRRSSAPASRFARPTSTSRRSTSASYTIPESPMTRRTATSGSA